MTMNRTRRAAERKFQAFPSSPRRLAGQQPDPYAVLRSPKEPAVCGECHAIFEKKRWRFDEPAYAQLRREKGTKVVRCPACAKIDDRYPDGVLTLRWDKLSEHRDDVLGLLRKQERRAKETNPLERIMRIEEEDGELRLFTTNTKLAQRLGRELERAFHGKTEYHWSHRDKLVRVLWVREDQN